MVSRLELIEAARGARPLDLAITNVNLVNVFTCEIYPADIGIYGDRVALVGPAGAYQLEAKATYDGSGKWAAPGFVTITEGSADEGVAWSNTGTVTAALDTDTVYLDLIDEMSPGVVRIDGNFLYVLMPMRVSG